MTEQTTFNRISQKAGEEPGTYNYIGTKIKKPVEISVIDYNEMSFEERKLDLAEDCYKYKDNNSVTWINVDGIQDPEVIIKIGKHYDLHPLVLEDISNTEHRPKLEEFENQIFVVLKMLTYSEKTQRIATEHISLVMGNNYVITFQEGVQGDVFETIRQRLRLGKGKLRKSGSDFLMYSLIDTIIDYYFVILENLGDKIEAIENEVIVKPDTPTLRSIYRMKREMMFLRKAIWPVREILNGFFHSETGLIDKSSTVYFRDAYDHTIQIMDTIELYRDMLAGMLDIYLSSISYKMNAVMKVLTIIATIFIPLTFITSIYGMNFEFMPELHWKYGYAGIWGVMIAAFSFMIFFFKRMKWF